MKTIKKFETDLLYIDELGHCHYWFELIERDGMRLTFKAIKVGSRSDVVKCHGTASLVADKDGAYEVVLLSVNNVPAKLMSKYCSTRMISVSKLPAEEQKIIIDAVKTDVAHRRNNPEDDNPDVCTIYDAEKKEIVGKEEI